MMKKFVAVAGLLTALAYGNSAKAQVQDVSVTVSPYVSYNWWNENIALKNSPFYGARVGFGFGPFFELRGNIEKSTNLKNAIKDKSWNPFNEDALNKIDGMNIDITRVGGEVKINLLDGYVVAPYLTAGAGVQIFDFNPFTFDNGNAVIDEAKKKEKQLYYALGAGIKFSLSDRIAFALEGKNIRFNTDKTNPYTKPNTNDKKNQWGNWAALASLDFYLGGNASANNAQDRRYRSLYNDGFNGMKFVVEPGVAFVDFKEKMNRQDQWFMGGSVGVDFNSLVGLRAFYYQATEMPNKLNFKFNKDLRMYGLNFVTRLNYPRGIVPYLQFGAGYLDDNNFIADVTNNERFKTHNLFALLGAGIEVPVSRWVALFGTANAMLMTDDLPLKDINTPSDIITNLSYTGGIRINIGSPASAPEFMVASSEANTSINNERAEVKEQSTMTREKRIRRQLFSNDVYVNANNMMTKQEFEEMVNRIMKKIRAEEDLNTSLFTDGEMEVVLTALNAQKGGQKSAVNSDSSNEAILKELRTIVRKLDEQKNAVPAATTIIAPASGAVQPATPAVPVQRVATPNVSENSEPQAVYGTPSNKTQTSYLKLNRLAALTGVNFGEGTQWVLGVRGYMQISDTSLDFVPEVMAGFGSKNSLDISANVIYNFNEIIESGFQPYAGLGVGLFNHGESSKFGTNIILGTNYKISNGGEFFADYSIRNLFKNNQIAVGYRFIF